MSRIALVLGGGGITGASFQIATLMALELACEWEANSADVVIGTSGGAYVAALVRSGRLDLDSLVRSDEDPTKVVDRIRSHIFLVDRRLEMRRWMRSGLLPGIKRPGLAMLLGSPARFGSSGLATWVEEQIGDQAGRWPDRPTIITAYDLADHRRVAFGTVGAPRVSVADAVAASSAIPVLFHPHVIDDVSYVDGGVVSGTHLDLVLGSPEPVDLVIVIAPIGAERARRGAWPHERLLDRVGRRSLRGEIDLVAERWPDTEILVLRPTPAVQAKMRPNPMSAAAAVPTFVETLHDMKRELASPETWAILERHLYPSPRDGRRISPDAVPSEA